MVEAERNNGKNRLIMLIAEHPELPIRAIVSKKRCSDFNAILDSSTSRLVRVATPFNDCHITRMTEYKGRCYEDTYIGHALLRKDMTEHVAEEHSEWSAAEQKEFVKKQMEELEWQECIALYLTEQVKV